MSGQEAVTSSNGGNDSDDLREDGRGVKRPLLASAPAPKIKKKKSKDCGPPMDAKAAKLLQRKQLQQELMKKQQKKLQEKHDKQLEQDEREKKVNVEKERLHQSTNYDSPKMDDDNKHCGHVNSLPCNDGDSINEQHELDSHTDFTNNIRPLAPDRLTSSSSKNATNHEIVPDTIEKLSSQKCSSEVSLAVELDKEDENSTSDNSGNSLIADTAPETPRKDSDIKTKSILNELTEVADEISNSICGSSASSHQKENCGLNSEGFPQNDCQLEISTNKNNEQVKLNAITTDIIKSDADTKEFIPSLIKSENDMKVSHKVEQKSEEIMTKLELDKTFTEADSWDQIAIDKKECMDIKKKDLGVNDKLDCAIKTLNEKSNSLVNKSEEISLNESSTVKDKKRSFKEEKEEKSGKDSDSDNEEKYAVKKKKRPRNGSSDSNKSNSSDEEEDSARRGRVRGGASLAARPKIKNMRKNIRDILSEDKLEEGTLAAQKAEKLRLQRLQEKRNAIREYMEKQEVCYAIYCMIIFILYPILHQGWVVISS